MIKDREEKIHQIVSKIENNISEINEKYRTGPELYFYRKIIYLRKNTTDINVFLNNKYNLEILYATLVSWDMNSRGAKMKYFKEFSDNILSCSDLFEQLESLETDRNIDTNLIIPILENTYNKLNLMKTDAKLVSNAKFLHFIFPHMFMPMDRKNILEFFYGNSNESIDKYIEIINISIEIMNIQEDWDKYLDSDWNASIPKLIDNAIILIMGKSIKT